MVRKYLKSDNGHLMFDGVDIAKLGLEKETPFYLYSENVIRERFNGLRDSLSDAIGREAIVAYSMKTAPMPLIYRLLEREGSWFEMTSEDDIRMLLSLGIPLGRCIYTNIWKSQHALELAISNGIGYIAIDSLSDLGRVSGAASRLKRGVKVLLRVNPGIEVKSLIFPTADPRSKYGVPIIPPGKMPGAQGDEAYSLIERILDDRWLALAGIHVHPGSQVTDLDYYRKFVDGACVFFKDIERRYGLVLEALDFGGGFSVNYRKDEKARAKDASYDINAHARTISSEMLRHKISAKVIVESGRYLVSEAGMLVSKVVVIKRLRSRKIVVIDACAYSDLLDIILTDWHFDMTIANKASQPRDDRVSIVGRTNDSLDNFDPLEQKGSSGGAFIPGNRLIQKSEEGDVLAVLDAGAYTASFNMNYCFVPKMAAYIIRKGKVIAARHRETSKDMFKNLVMP